ncbi:MAG: hypothetical protein ACYSTF_01070 [Planctomycetota bacterium]|jgi:hypothetical protein
MTKIVLSVEEIREILLSNDWIRIPPYIKNLRVGADAISLIVEIGKTGIPLMPSVPLLIPISARFVRFDNPVAIFEITNKGRLTKGIVDLLIPIFKDKMPEYVEVDYPNIHVDVSKLLVEKNIKGVQVEEIVFDDGKFTVVTGNASNK